eukprot:TRINITY_DN2581_c0_g1_i2.p1 TRINITY_DN2581_c0_g1~~TRINITY_DN2581_c0_g1_i2.p1  ORF type:complete len:794 (-),score=315.34 TRINITY_DN2581_c0_g1_i2:36-2417(-)
MSSFKKKRNRLLADDEEPIDTNEKKKEKKIAESSEKSPTECYINDLPAEILIQIFSHLKNFKDVLACEFVCTFWRDYVLFADEDLWKPLCEKKWGKTFDMASYTWKESFFNRVSSLNLIAQKVRLSILSDAKSANKNLELKNLQLTSVPSAVFKAVHINKLNLSNNRLIHMPTNLHFNPNLLYLHLSSNNIEKLSPLGESTLVCLGKLETLDLSFNYLSSFPLEILKLKALKTLLLGSNKIQAIPEEISELQHLEVLHLFNNKLSALPSSLWKLKNLKGLFINNNLKLKVIPKGIEGLESLEELSVDIGIEKSISRNFMIEVRGRMERKENNEDDERWKNLRKNTTEDDILDRTRRKMERERNGDVSEESDDEKVKKSLKKQKERKEKNGKEEVEEVEEKEDQLEDDNDNLWQRKLDSKYVEAECVPNKSLPNGKCTIESITLLTSSKNFKDQITFSFGVKGSKPTRITLDSRQTSISVEFKWNANQAAFVKASGLREGFKIHIWGSKDKEVGRLFTIVSDNKGTKKELPISPKNNSNSNPISQNQSQKSPHKPKKVVELLSSDDEKDKPITKKKTIWEQISESSSEDDSSTDSDLGESAIIYKGAIEEMEEKRKRAQEILKKNRKKKIKISKKKFRDDEAEEGSEEEDGEFDENELREMETADNVSEEERSEDDEEIAGEFDSFIVPSDEEQSGSDGEQFVEEEEEEEDLNYLDGGLFESNKNDPISLDSDEEERNQVSKKKRILKKPNKGEVIDLDDEIESTPKPKSKRKIIREESSSEDDAFIKYKKSKR